MRKQGFIRSFQALSIYALGFCGVFAAAQPAYAQARENQLMTYEVYAGGINAVRAELNLSRGAEDYSLTLAARTKGFLARLAPWEGTFETRGWRLQDGDRPELHKSTAIWRGEEDYKEYYYGRDASFKKLVLFEPGMSAPATQEIDPELTQGTTDALTATLKVMEAVTADGKCEGRSEVFDGKRRFALVFTHAAEEKLESSRYNVFEGTAMRCDVEVVPVAGGWHAKPRGWMSIQEQGREKGSLPTVWMASLAEGQPAVPVKIRVRTDFGVLFMHLAGYENGTHSISARTGAEDNETVLPKTTITAN